jgi:hypothetical protein
MLIEIAGSFFAIFMTGCDAGCFMKSDSYSFQEIPFFLWNPNIYYHEELFLQGYNV